MGGVKKITKLKVLKKEINTHRISLSMSGSRDDISIDEH